MIGGGREERRQCRWQTARRGSRKGKRARPAVGSEMNAFWDCAQYNGGGERRKLAGSATRDGGGNASAHCPPQRNLTTDDSGGSNGAYASRNNNKTRVQYQLHDRQQWVTTTEDEITRIARCRVNVK